MTRRQFLALVLVILGVAAFYPYAMGNANAKADASATEADISFGDSTHKIYFNYQGYLVQRKSGGETAETWKALAVPERLKKVKEGESFLEKLHKELLAKPTLAPEEQDLIQAVWGKEDASNILEDAHHAAIAKEGSAPKELVNNLSEKVEGFHGKSNWGQMFDGNRLSGNDGVDASGVSGNRGSGKTQVAFSAKPEVAKGDGIISSTVPIKKEDEHPRGNALPLAAGGAVLLVGGYFGIMAVRRKLDSGAEGVLLADGKWEKPVMSGHALTSSCTTGTTPIDLGCAFGNSDVPPPKPCKQGGGETGYCGTGGTHNYEVKCVSGGQGRQAG